MAQERLQEYKQGIGKMTYEEVLEYMYHSLPMYQRQGDAAYKADLSRTIAIDAYFNHPHKAYPSIHIAGTNGKGSVSHMLASVLQEAGYKTGLYTSPHLKDFRERIRINGKMISKENVVHFILRHKDIFQQQKASFFEMTAALAFEFFRQEHVDIAVIETGMGGRLDSTNIIQPLLSIITSIGHDHERYLGNSIAGIAAEKAGIIKKGTPVIVGENQEDALWVFKDTSRKQKAPLIEAINEFHLEMFNPRRNIQEFHYSRNGQNFRIATDLMGRVQKKNIPVVLSAVNELKKFKFHFPRTALRRGFINTIQNTGIRGRWDKIGSNPDVYCDIAHNQEGLEHSLAQLQLLKKPIHIIIGMVEDKDPDAILSLFPQNAWYYVSQPKIPRAMKKEKLFNHALEKGLNARKYASIPEALHAAKHNAGKNDVIYVGGSTLTVAEVL